MNSTCYIYTPSSLPSGTLADQKFYISYHKHDAINNPYYQYYPMDIQKGGVLIWHSRTNTLGLSTDFSDWRRMPIDIEAAHGKTNWQETDTDVINTGIENPLTGRDKLEIRKIVLDGGHWTEIADPYFGTDHGDGTIFYTPDDGKDFTLLTNPNSNWYNSAESYSQNKSSGFSIKNIRTSGSIVYADFTLNDYTVTSNTTLKTGTWYIYDDIIVNSGVTLTIPVGTTIKFASGVGLTINGTLNATNATFTGETSLTYWAGIHFASGSLGYLNGCTINNVQTYGGGAIVITDANPIIQYCTIEDNVGATSGIHVLSGSYPNINNNTIVSTYHGIYINHSSGYLRYNDITGSSSSGRASVYCYYYANPLFGGIGGGMEDGYNILNDGYYNIYAGYNSTPTAGGTIGARWNQFIDAASYNAYATGNSTISAQNDYWSPSVSTYAEAGSYIYTDPTWDGSKANMNITAKQDNLSTTYSSDRKNDLLTAREMRFDGNCNAAIAVYKDVIESKGLTSDAQIAIAELGHTYKETKDKSITDYINTIITNKDYDNEYRPVAYEVLAGVSSWEGSKEEAKVLSETLIKEYPNSVHEKNGYMNLFFYYYNNNDYEKASEMLDNIKEDFKDKDEFNAAAWLLTFAGKIYNDEEENFQNQEVVSNEKMLFDNYPNPFNPTTTIKYQIQEAGMVIIKVYDILGKEITTLAKEYQTMGAHSVEFDATCLPSGVYIYTLQTGGQIFSRKMLLLK